MIENKDSGRIKRDDQRAGDETDRVKKVHHLKCHEACYHGKNKDAISKSSERLIVKTFGPLVFPEENSIEEVDGSPHGAEPTAEEIAKDKNEEQYPEARQHPQDDLFLGENRDDSDERIESKVEINRDSQFEWKSGLNDQVEKKTKG